MLKESAVVMSYDAETGIAKVKCQITKRLWSLFG